ncbi:MAG: bacteriophage Gp15 family protein [archaeon]|nr:bacteriophage Gp15 family protein [archaeon]
MINAFYEPFPDAVIIEGREYRIVTDFGDWLAFADMIDDSELEQREKVIMMSEWFIEPPDIMTKEAVNSLFSFYHAKELEPPEIHQESEEETETEATEKPPVLNWKIDAPYIIGDFQRYYRIDLLKEKMHWWKFRILFSALPSESQIMKRMGYRGADIGDIKNEDERKRIMKLKQLYALPFELDEYEIGEILAK